MAVVYLVSDRNYAYIYITKMSGLEDAVEYMRLWVSIFLVIVSSIIVLIGVARDFNTIDIGGTCWVGSARIGPKLHTNLIRVGLCVVCLGSV